MYEYDIYFGMMKLRKVTSSKHRSHKYHYSGRHSKSPALAEGFYLYLLHVLSACTVVRTTDVEARMLDTLICKQKKKYTGYYMFYTT